MKLGPREQALRAAREAKVPVASIVGIRMVAKRRQADVHVTEKMIDAGVEALLSSFSDEYLSWLSPGLDEAVCRVFRAMLASSAQGKHKASEARGLSSLSSRLRAQSRGL